MENTTEQSLSVDELWNKYHEGRANGDRDFYRNKLIMAYSPFLEEVCGFVSKKLPSSIELDDIKSWGVIGLMDAIEKYDKTRGRFEPWAHYKVEKTIIYELRKLDFVPRMIRLRSIQLNTAIHNLKINLGRKPNETDLINELSNDDVYPSNPENPNNPLKSKGEEKARLIMRDANRMPKIFYLKEFGGYDDKTTRFSESGSSKRPISSAIDFKKKDFLTDPKSQDACDEAGKKDFKEFLEKPLTRDKRLILNLRCSNYVCSNSAKVSSNTLRHSEREMRWHGVPYKKIAKIVGNISEATIRKKYNSALKQLKDNLTNRGLTLEDCLNELS